MIFHHLILIGTATRILIVPKCLKIMSRHIEVSTRKSQLRTKCNSDNYGYVTADYLSWLSIISI